MSLLRALATIGCGLVLVLSASAAPTNELGWTLDSVLTQLDRQTDDFKTALADVDIRWGSTGQSEAAPVARTGRAYINAAGVMRFNEQKPGNRVLLVTKEEVQDYDPVRALVDRYALAKHKARLEPYAQLGFTTTGKDLKDRFLLTLLGEDRIDGKRVVGLELTPKKEQVRETVARLQVWIDQASWMPVRQVITHVASGDTLTVTYSAMARNLQLNEDLFKANWPKGTQSLKR